MDASLSQVDALAISGLRKAFDKPVVKDLTLQVRPGELYALLGSNGAGKTTTLRMVAGLIAPDAGSVHIFGIDCAQDPLAARAVTAWVPDEPMIYDKLTPLEYMALIAGLWSVKPALAAQRTDELFTTLGLNEVANQRCEAFSRGMKQKVALAGALVHEPRLLLLDEPLTGLDAAMARIVKDLLDARVRGGATIILTTHILEVAERMASRIGILHHGELVAEGTFSQLQARFGGGKGSLEDVFVDLVTDTRSAA
ncbi:MAG: ABC transporter ATP-binding protein [Hyphomicrobiales bacterium]|nr:ABC transporter ATP-binding protein [Hyphomicrobiales bacterium]